MDEHQGLLGTVAATGGLPRPTSLQIPTLRLFPFQRFKQRFEIAGSETLAAVTPDHFVENRWPILDRLAENLE